VNLTKVRLLVLSYYDVQEIRVKADNTALEYAKLGRVTYRDEQGVEKVIVGKVTLRRKGEQEEDENEAPRRKQHEFPNKEKWKKGIPLLPPLPDDPVIEWKVKESPQAKAVKIPIERVIAWKPYVTIDEAEAHRDWCADRMEQMEVDLKGKVMDEIREHPFWIHWLRKIKGIGPCLGGALLAHVDPSRARTPSSLYKLFGIIVGEDGLAIKRQKGVKLGYSPFLKKTAFLIGESFIKGRSKESYYRDKYEIFRAEIDARPCPLEARGLKHHVGKGEKAKEIPCPKSHKLAMARRKTVKLFLSHLWKMWREMLGLPTCLPYPFESHPRTGFIGHDIASLYPPPVNGDRDEKDWDKM
jgi:hypothetical protein